MAGRADPGHGIRNWRRSLVVTEFLCRTPSGRTVEDRIGNGKALVHRARVYEL